MADPSARPPEHVHLLKALASLALDYVRWTQLVPMLFAWTFLLILVGALLLTNFQDASFSLLERGMAVYEKVAGPFETPAPEAGTEREATAESTTDAASEPAVDDGTEPDSVRLTDEDIFPVVLRAWALLALVGWLFGVLRTLLFGPRKPVRIGPKLRIAAYAAIGCSGLMWIAYLLGTETFHGSIAGWAALFLGLPFAVWCVSAWSLAVGHLVGRLQRHLHG